MASCTDLFKASYALDSSAQSNWGYSKQGLFNSLWVSDEIPSFAHNRLLSTKCQKT